MTTSSAWFRCGELEESYPQAHKAFLEEFACSIELVDFCVDPEGDLWAHVGAGDEAEQYKWNGSTWADYNSDQ
jgi:hypothetical protein